MNKTKETSKPNPRQERGAGASKKEETLVRRPRSKPAASTRGKLNEWDNGYKEFIPYGTREPNRTMIKQMGDSSFYKNEGKKDSSFSLHLNVDGKSEDPVGEMEEQFYFLTEGERKHAPKLLEDGQGRMLMDNGKDLQIWFDSGRNQVIIQACLECQPDIDRMLLQAQAQMNVTIARHRKELLGNHSNSQRK